QPGAYRLGSRKVTPSPHSAAWANAWASAAASTAAGLDAAADSVAMTSSPASGEMSRCSRSTPAKGPLRAAQSPAAPAAPLGPQLMPHLSSSETAIAVQESSMARQQLTPACKFLNEVKDIVPHCSTLMAVASAAETGTGSPAARAAMMHAAPWGS